VTDDLPEPDRQGDAPHPRHAAQVFGHEAAAAEVLAAHAGGRMHHAWLLTGPRGIGKATFAWAVARFLLAAPEAGLFGAAATLDLAPDDPVLRRMAQLSEPRLFLLRRGPNEKGNALSQDIRMAEVERLIHFLRLKAADGASRVVIVDAVDDMNPSAANAMLKVLEEPPAGVTFLMVSHQPGRLLPTIRSRARRLSLGPLRPEDLAAALAQAGVAVAPGDAAALAALAGGSAGDALRLVAEDGLPAYRALVHLMQGLPRLDRKGAITLADRAAGRGGAEVLDLILALLAQFLARAARTGISGPPVEAAAGEAALLARIAPDVQAAQTWAGLAARLLPRARAARALNLDPATLLLDTLLKVEEGAPGHVPAPARSP
jgi:DNA polymerase-3 subunit delta'